MMKDIAILGSGFEDPLLRSEVSLEFLFRMFPFLKQLLILQMWPIMGSLILRWNHKLILFTEDGGFLYQC